MPTNSGYVKSVALNLHRYIAYRFNFQRLDAFTPGFRREYLSSVNGSNDCRHLAQPRYNGGERISDFVDQVRFSTSPARAGTTARRRVRRSAGARRGCYSGSRGSEHRQRCSRAEHRCHRHRPQPDPQAGPRSLPDPQCRGRRAGRGPALGAGVPGRPKAAGALAVRPIRLG